MAISFGGIIPHPLWISSSSSSRCCLCILVSCWIYSVIFVYVSRFGWKLCLLPDLAYGFSTVKYSSFYHEDFECIKNEIFAKVEWAQKWLVKNRALFVEEKRLSSKGNSFFLLHFPSSHDQNLIFVLESPRQNVKITPIFCLWRWHHYSIVSRLTSEREVALRFRSFWSHFHSLSLFSEYGCKRRYTCGSLRSLWYVWCFHTIPVLVRMDSSPLIVATNNKVWYLCKQLWLPITQNVFSLPSCSL